MKKLLERFEAYFLAMGYKKMPYKNTNYRLFALTFVSDSVIHVRYVFLGSNGAVRVNIDNKSAAGSFSKTEQYRKILDKWEASKLTKSTPKRANDGKGCVGARC